VANAPGEREADHPVMTSPHSTNKVLVVSDSRPVATLGQTGSPVRRYRLARLRFDGRASDPAARYEHLKRVFD
jgi:hypothetical protein